MLVIGPYQVQFEAGLVSPECAGVELSTSRFWFGRSVGSDGTSGRLKSYAKTEGEWLNAKITDAVRSDREQERVLVRVLFDGGGRSHDIPPRKNLRTSYFSICENDRHLPLLFIDSSAFFGPTPKKPHFFPSQSTDSQNLHSSSRSNITFESPNPTDFSHCAKSPVALPIGLSSRLRVQ